MIRKNKMAFRPSPIPKGTLSSILTVKLANDMPAHQFEPTKDILIFTDKPSQDLSRKFIFL